MGDEIIINLSTNNGPKMVSDCSPAHNRKSHSLPEQSSFSGYERPRIKIINLLCAIDREGTGVRLAKKNEPSEDMTTGVHSSTFERAQMKEEGWRSR